MSSSPLFSAGAGSGSTKLERLIAEGHAIQEVKTVGGRPMRAIILVAYVVSASAEGALQAFSAESRCMQRVDLPLQLHAFEREALS